MKHILLVLIVVTVAACAQKKLVTEELLQEWRDEAHRDAEQEARITPVAFRVTTGAVSLCGDKVFYAPSFSVYQRTQRTTYDREAAKARGIEDDDVHIILVVPGSPADRAGLRNGDLLVELDGWPVPSTKFAVTSVTTRIRDARGQEGAYRLTIRRDTELLRFEIPRVKACNVTTNAIGGKVARADIFAGVISFGGPLMDLIHDDDELALVISHELAHHILGHEEERRADAKRRALINKISTAIFLGTGAALSAPDALPPSPYRQQIESDADYAGMYYAARAGYDVSKAPQLWRRLADVYPKASGDPGPRWARLDEIVTEIANKRATGRELAPDPQPTE